MNRAPRLRAFVVLLSGLLSGSARERLLRRLYGYDVHPSAQIGLSLVSVDRLEMGPGASIGHMTVCKGLARLEMKEHAQIGRLCWISGYPLKATGFYSHLPERDPSLVMDRHATITHRHILDCTDRIYIGQFAGLGGYRTQILTHSIDIHENRQSASPVSLGDYTFIATGCILLGGSSLPERSVLAAGSVLRAAADEPGLYAGVPAKRVAEIPDDAAFFYRAHGRIS